MRLSLRRPAAAAAPFLLVLSLAGCGDSKPAVCSDLDALRASVENLKDVNISENGMTAFTSGLSQIGGDLDQLGADAKSQYQSEVAAVRQALDTLGSSVNSAVADPGPTSFAAVRTAVAGVGDSLSGLDSAVSGTC